ncbi:arsenate reductase family protein [Tenuifilum thalassicum]|uniref:Arsenate reductase family protein n=1 Tax=Tenuifilum thalassicum TaxID=2590900 RepID=A0A7D4BCJ1_9BACT|nr:arsenate reductase family protein [Tenuifilum thalassicum]QKG80920.1 arsenate reductase family protein [Tenuifilum thalassicum]
MIKILHNPWCAKSRKGLEYLRTKTEDFEIVKYLDEGLSEDMLKEILLKSNLKPIELVRTQEEYYKKYLKNKNFNEDEWIRIIIENPKLLQRPIVISKYKAVIGIPPENIDNIF